MIGTALDAMLALTLGFLTLVGLGVMAFAGYTALFTKVDAKTPREGIAVYYGGWGVIVVAVLFVCLLLGMFLLGLTK